MTTGTNLSFWARRYALDGYKVVTNPSSLDLPDFAKDFRVDMAATREDEGILVSVKKTRQDLSDDPEVKRYAAITEKHEGWRFDFIILESENPRERELQGAQEMAIDQIITTLERAETLAHGDTLYSAIIIAWSAFESAMRQYLRWSGQKAGWGISPRQMINELYSSGVFSTVEFQRILELSRLRNEIVHGFVPSTNDAEVVSFLIEITSRMLAEGRATQMQTVE
jgi:uncharacterized protein YutE (UPF0331/DUF86 family)